MVDKLGKEPLLNLRKLGVNATRINEMKQKAKFAQRVYPNGTSWMCVTEIPYMPADVIVAVIEWLKQEVVKPNFASVEYMENDRRALELAETIMEIRVGVGPPSERKGLKAIRDYKDFLWKISLERRNIRSV